MMLGLPLVDCDELTVTVIMFTRKAMNMMTVLLLMFIDFFTNLSNISPVELYTNKHNKKCRFIDILNAMSCHVIKCHPTK